MLTISICDSITDDIPQFSVEGHKIQKFQSLLTEH